MDKLPGLYVGEYRPVESESAGTYQKVEESEHSLFVRLALVAVFAAVMYYLFNYIDENSLN